MVSTTYLLGTVPRVGVPPLPTVNTRLFRGSFFYYKNLLDKSLNVCYDIYTSIVYKTTVHGSASFTGGNATTESL